MVRFIHKHFGIDNYDNVKVIDDANSRWMLVYFPRSKLLDRLMLNALIRYKILEEKSRWRLSRGIKPDLTPQQRGALL